MFRKLVIGSIVAALGAASVGTVFADGSVSASKMGSLLAYSKIELKWSRRGDSGPYVLTQDTFLSISNNYPEQVVVRLFFVNGDPPLAPVFVGNPPLLIERGHPGWNWMDCEIMLTPNQPTYWTASTGQPVSCPPFEVLDFGNPPGRPDPDNSRARVLRGFLYAWATDWDGNQIHWNHLTGDAAIINYPRHTEAKYNAYAFQAVDRTDGPQHGEIVGTPGTLELNGIDYDQPFSKLVFGFYASGSPALSRSLTSVLADTDLTLHPVSADLRQDNTGPVCTKAVFDIWNQNEIRFSGTHRCICCWDQTLASQYDPPNHFLAGNLQTDRGWARIDGRSSAGCHSVGEDAAMLGVVIDHLVFRDRGPWSFFGGRLQRESYATGAMTFFGEGREDAVIRYDVTPPPGGNP